MSEQAQATAEVEEADDTWGDEAEGVDALEVSKGDERTITIKTHGRSETITYDWSYLTPKIERQFMSGKESAFTVAYALVSAMVRVWSLKDRKGNPLPVGDDGCDDVPFLELVDISNAILEDQFPNPTADAEA